MLIFINTPIFNGTYNIFPRKWNSIFVRRVKKTVFRFPFYREWNCKVFQISIFGQCPNFLQNATPWHTKTVLESFHSTPNFSLLQNVLSKQNELSKTCLSSCFVSTTPHKEQLQVEANAARQKTTVQWRWMRNGFPFSTKLVLTQTTFPFYRISILSGMSLQGFWSPDFHFIEFPFHREGTVGW